MRLRRAAHRVALSAPIDNAAYDRLGWRDDSSPLSLLGGTMTAVRFGYLRELMVARLGRPLVGLRALEIGCGGGYMTEQLALAGCETVGVDPSEPSLVAARSHAERAGLEIEYRAGAGERLPVDDGAFDLVCCCDVLEHVDDLQLVIAETARALAPGGVYFFDTINRTPLSRLVAIRLMQEWPATRLLDFTLHEYARFVRPAELRDTLRGAGLLPGPMVGLVPRRPLSLLRAAYACRRGRVSFGELGRTIELAPGRSRALAYMGHALKP